MMHHSRKVVEMMQSGYIRRIFAIHRSFYTLRIVTTPPFAMDKGYYCTLNRLKKRHLPSKFGTHILHIRMQNFSTTMSDDEIKRRLDMFQDLYVVARDCMEDLVNAQENEETDDDDDDDDDDDENDDFLQQVAFLQDSIEAAVKEYNNLLNDLNDNGERKDRIMKNHGFKVKQLELELAMLLQNTNLNYEDDSGNKVENDSDDDDDDCDDLEEEDDEEEEEDHEGGRK
jgi:hypothetical protein